MKSFPRLSVEDNLRAIFETVDLTHAEQERRIDRLLQQAWSQRPRWLEGVALALLAVCSLLGVRPAQPPLVPSAAPGVLVDLAGAAASSVEPDGPLMSIDQGDVPDCVRQSHGAQCVP